MLCMYVRVFRAENVHVLEYAMKDDDKNGRVRYAQTHEFIRGQPKIVWQDGDSLTVQGGLQKYRARWLSLPSEEVNYCAIRAALPFKSWIGPEYYTEPYFCIDQSDNDLDNYEFPRISK
jgi:hypothetical protein